MSSCVVYCMHIFENLDQGTLPNNKTRSPNTRYQIAIIVEISTLGYHLNVVDLYIYNIDKSIIC